MGSITEEAGIRTPLELDLAARAAERLIERHVSPLRRFSILTDFFGRTLYLPQVWTASYYRDFFAVLSTCVRHEYVCWVDPSGWQIVVNVLNRLRNADWVHGEAGFGETESTAWEKCCASLANMGDYRALHTLLQSHGWATADIHPDAWITVFTARSLGKDGFSEYVAALSAHDMIPPFLTRAFERLQHARADAAWPGVVLVDGAAVASSAPGMVLHPEVSFTRAASWRVHFNNALAEENTASHRQLTRSLEAARRMVAEQFRVHPEPRACVLRFHEHDAAYSGESMGLAVALQLLELLQSDFNRTVRWKLLPGLCCTGGVDEDGSVRAVPREALLSKISAAFFSPCEAMVLHASHLEEALPMLHALQARWPAGRMQLFGVSSLAECIAAPGIVQIARRNPYDRTREYAQHHTTLLLFSAVLLLLVAAGYFWWKSTYGYPDLEYAAGAAIGQNALVYNPHRAGDWQFRDYDAVIEPLLPFGDIEIGADNTRNVWLWNMTPSPLDVMLAIEGPQADQWYISWNGGRQSITATDSLRVMVKYVPTRESSGNEAAFTVRDPESGELLAKLALRGRAGPPRPAGYALYFDGKDDLLHFGENAIAFARDEGTLEFWFRPDGESGCIFSNNRNVPDSPAIQNMTIAYSEAGLEYLVGNNTGPADIGVGQLGGSGTWYHLALTFSRSNRSIRMFLDGKVILEKSEEFIIEYFMRPFVTFGAYFNEESVQSPFRGALDEIRMWDSALPPDVIRARMKKKVSGLARGLLGYWDFDVVAEVSAHNANERSGDGILLHRPAYIRSNAPLDGDHTDAVLVHGPDGRTALELQPLRWLQCGSDPVQGSAERSYAIRFLSAPPNKGTIMSIMNQDAYCAVRDASVVLNGRDRVPLPIRSGWNTLIVRVGSSHIADFILNGKPEFSLTTTEFARGPAYRYEGLQIGIFNDKYNIFGPKYYDRCRPQLLRNLAVRDFSVWKKRLTLAEIQSIERGELPRDALAAHWPLDKLPDSDNNLRDYVGGHVLHMWRYLGWQ